MSVVSLCLSCQITHMCGLLIGMENSVIFSVVMVIETETAVFVQYRTTETEVLGGPVASSVLKCQLCVMPVNFV